MCSSSSSSPNVNESPKRTIRRVFAGFSNANSRRFRQPREFVLIGAREWKRAFRRLGRGFYPNRG